MHVTLDDYERILDRNKIYYVCRFKNVKKIPKKFEIDVDVSEKVITVEVHRVKNPTIDLENMLIAKRIVRKKVKETYGLNPYLLIDIIAILKLLNNNSIFDLIALRNNEIDLEIFSDVYYFAPKTVAPYVIVLKANPRYFAIIAPKVYEEGEK